MLEKTRGTPYIVYLQSEFKPLMETNCDRSCKHEMLYQMLFLRLEIYHMGFFDPEELSECL